MHVYKNSYTINFIFGGRLESRTLKGLLTLDAFQVRSHRQLGWPSLLVAGPGFEPGMLLAYETGVVATLPAINFSLHYVLRN